MKSKKGLSFSNNCKRVILIVLFFVLQQSIAISQEIQVKVGVLALRGSEECLQRWTPTADYLTDQIPGHTFVIVPLDFEQIFETVKNGKVDFALENSSIYVELEYLYGIDRIATLNKKCCGNASNQFGGVIFTTKNRNDINFLDDLENKKFMAVDETSFGGWIMAQREFMDFEIDPYNDFASLQFGDTHDNVVYAVREGEVDAGTIRTGILEKMDIEGKIDINDFKILNQQQIDNYFLLISTRLYPEWPLAKVKHTSNKLAQQVSIALLSMSPFSEAAINAGIDGWTIPNNYQPVHDCLKDLRVSPYQDIGKITLANLIQQYWEWILISFISIFILITIVIYISRLYGKLNLTTIELAKSRKSLEQKVKERTSELKSSNNELNLERNKLKVIMDAMDNGLYIVSQQFDIQYINAATEREFGPVKGRKCYNYFHDRTEVCPWCKNIEIFEGKSVHWEWYSEKNKKTYHLFDTPIVYTEGSVSKLEIFHDITKIVEAQEILQKSEQKYRTLIEGTFDIVMSISFEGNILSWNRRAEDVFGYKANEIIGKNASLLVPKELLTEQKETLLKVKEFGFVEGLESIRVAKDGTQIPVEMTVSRMDDANGNLIGLSGIFRDISERKRSKEQLVMALEKATESDRLKTAFLNNFSHEIRTPMNGILGFVGLLKEPELSGEQQKQFIKIIETSSARMISTVDDLVNISMIESQQAKVSISEANVNEQTEDIERLLSLEAEKKGLKLILRNSLAVNEANIKTDKSKIYGILTNIVKNAIKFTHEGSVEFGYNIKGDNIEFFVIDTGIGIPKDRQKEIFDRFVKADIEDKAVFEGSGLGLTIAKAYVEMLGGNIWLESEVGIGSKFYFTIPYNPVNKELAINNDELVNDKSGNSVKDLVILVVEDEEVINKYLSIILSNISESLLYASNGSEAVEICRNNPNIDLVLMDIKMPFMNGYNAIKQIRSFNKDLIIIAQTAYALKGDREKAIEAGCNDYISKPINKHELIEMIEKLAY